MRGDLSKMPLDHQSEFQVNLYDRSSTAWVDVMQGIATGAFDLSPFMRSGRHTVTEATITLTWDSTGAFLANQPQIGDLIEIRDTLDNFILWIGVIEELNNYNEERGNRTLAITARTRDGVGPWRKRRYVSPRFQEGGTLMAAAHEICHAQGLEEDEFVLPLDGAVIPHTNVQFADQTPWQALTLIGIAIGYTPYTDALGRIKFYNRAVDRPPDITLENEDVIRIKGGKGRPSISAFRLKWLDRNLTKVVQQDQVLGQATIPAGFFKSEQAQKIYWSDDRRARAENTHMKVIESVNSGLVNVGSESYTQVDRFHGEILVEVDTWVPVLATASLAAMIALDWVPDGVIVFGIGPAGGETIPTGRIVRGIAEAALLLIMMSIGVGTYEVWGEPFDYVHAVNKTEAYDENAPVWMEDIEEEENDLIFNETHAQEVVIRELLHRVASTNRWDTVITDDPRIEPGDILQLPDTSRLYVTNYARDISRGAQAHLSVSGFRV